MDVKKQSEDEEDEDKQYVVEEAVPPPPDAPELDVVSIMNSNVARQHLGDLNILLSITFKSDQISFAASLSSLLQLEASYRCVRPH